VEKNSCKSSLKNVQPKKEAAKMNIIRNDKGILTGMTLFLIGIIVLGFLGALLGVVSTPIWFVLGNIAVILLLIFSRDVRMIVFVGIPVNIVLVIGYLFRHFFSR
jgi:flagellar biosynthesis protein FliP